MQLFAMVGRMRLVSDREVIVAAKRVCGELVIFRENQQFATHRV